MKKAVIFDLDGTLLDTLDDLADSMNFVLQRHGRPARLRDEIRRFVGNGVPKLVERALFGEPSSDIDPELYETCLEEFKEYYKDHSAQRTAPYHGVTEMLEALKDAKISVGVVSNKLDIATRQLCRDYFGELVDFAVGDREGIEKKPAPDSVLEVIRRMECGTAVYVGDSDVDIMTAKNAGLPCISVTWGFRDKAFLEAHGGKLFADTPSETFEIALRLLDGYEGSLRL